MFIAGKRARCTKSRPKSEKVRGKGRAWESRFGKHDRYRFTSGFSSLTFDFHVLFIGVIPKYFSIDASVDVGFRAGKTHKIIYF